MKIENLKKLAHFRLAHNYIHLADDVYDADNLPTDNGWKVIENADDLEFKRTSNSFNAKLYSKQNKFTGKTQYVIAFKGFNEIGDITNVFSLLAYRMPSQFKDAYNFTKYTVEKHDLNLKEIHFTGHSLGGFLAQAVGISVNSKKMIVFNSPAIKEINVANIKNTVQKIDHDKKDNAFSTKNLKQRLISISSSRDPIAGWGIHKGTNYQYHTHKSHHTIDSLKELIEEDAKREIELIQMEKIGHRVTGVSLNEIFNMVNHERNKVQNSATELVKEASNITENVIDGTVNGIGNTIRQVDIIADNLETVIEKATSNVERTVSKGFKKFKKLF